MICDRRYAGLASVLLVLTILSAFAAPVRAVDRTDGDYWTYNVSTNMMDIDVTGTMMLTFIQTDTLVIESESHDVNVLLLTGSMNGTGEISGIAVAVTVAYWGHIYEAVGSLATVKEDVYTWANYTMGTGQSIHLDTGEWHDVSTYAPPLGEGLVPSDMELGDSWDETLTVTSNSTYYFNGIIEHEENETSEDVAYSFEISSSMDSVEVAAGTFECQVINQTDETSGDLDVSWWSEEVGYFVKMASYAEDENTPFFSLELKDYSYEPPEDENEIVKFFTSWLGIVILIVIVVAIVAAVALSRRRR